MHVLACVYMNGREGGHTLWCMHRRKSFLVTCNSAKSVSDSSKYRQVLSILIPLLSCKGEQRECNTLQGDGIISATSEYTTPLSNYI